MPQSTASSANKIHVGLLWHSPNSGNLGVGALTVANMALIDAAAEQAGIEAHYTILGFADPGAPIYVSHPRLQVVPLTGRALMPGGTYGAALRRLDVVIDIGGGDSFAEIYGAKRFTYLMLTKVLARLRRVPLVLAPQTIGPFTRQPYRALATAIMRSAEMVVVRDPMSYAAAQEMSGAIRLIQTADVAFALPYDPAPQRDDGKVRVGINASGLLFNRGYSGTNEFGMELDYPEYTRQLIVRLLAEPGVELWLVPHVNSDVLPMDDDWTVAQRLQQEFPALHLAPRFGSPSEAKSFISGLDFLIAGRMHACIAAFSAGVPVIPVAYSRKFAGLFTALLDYDHMLPVRGMQTEAALTFTLECFHRRAELRAEVARGTGRARELLDGYVTYLSGLLARLGSG